MASHFSKRVAENILPLSDAKELREAFKEWLYTGNLQDNENVDESCKLCGHPAIRYEFQIWNKVTGATLWAGSECIKKFAIAVRLADGTVLTGARAAETVDADRTKLEEVARQRGVANALSALRNRDVDCREMLTGIAKHYEKNGAMTPKQLSSVLWRLEVMQIPFRHSDFKLKIRKDKEKDQLLTMEQWKLAAMWPCLSSAQRAWCRERRDDCPA